MISPKPRVIIMFKELFLITLCHFYSNLSKPSIFLTESANKVGHISRQVDIEVNENKKGMVLPFAPLSITFDNVRYSVDMPKVVQHTIAALIFSNKYFFLRKEFLIFRK